MLLHELQHRVRNILAVVRSVAHRTGKSSDSVEAYADTLESRINSMARTQNVLTSAPDAAIDLHTLVKEELVAQGGEPGGQVDISGPSISLSGKAAESLTLALHELATNAAKYGGLSTPDGHLSVTWEIKKTGNGQSLSLTWHETGVAVAPPSRRGFGSELVENVVPYEFGGTGKLEFGSDGIICLFDLPLSGELRAGNGDGAGPREPDD